MQQTLDNGSTAWSVIFGLTDEGAQKFRQACIDSSATKDPEGHPYKTDDYIVLNFSQVFSIPKGYALNHARACGDRLRLRSPFKERMSQAFAKYFMRIYIEDGEEITPFIVRIEDD